ncbi:LptE family protein [uncultured Muribaculum sp.]|uniref:LptE family protein n=1 Tax=uncultured Muribaculum sp. TaxID=1918613 RepID=UPI0025D32074|nr:LptE family protein [uncultured Muribaculum sp.]
MHQIIRTLSNRISANCYVAILTLTLIATSCTISYKFNGSAIDYNVYKTIHIGQFPIRAALVYPPLQQTFENALLDYVARNTRLQVNDGMSDLNLEGEITGYSLSPQAVTENAIASKTRLTITVRIRYTDSKNDKNNVDQSFSAYQDFDSNEMLTDVQEQLCQEITDQLIDLIFNATLGNW